jgi:hypothetical protein
MRRFLAILTLLLLLGGTSFAWVTSTLTGGGVPSGAASYCSGITWPVLTSPDFTLDFDHTTDTKDACVVGDTTEDGECVPTAGCATDTIIDATPPATSPGSGGNALDVTGGIFYRWYASNTSQNYMDSTDGELILTFYYATYGGTDTGLFIATGDSSNGFEFFLDTVEDIYVRWEDSGDDTTVQTGCSVGGNIAKWIQLHFQWDITRCTQGDGNCADAGEDEFACRTRVYDAGWGAWTAWQNETSGEDFGAFATAIGTNGIRYGTHGLESHDIHLDDLEIKKTYSSWKP